MKLPALATAMLATAVTLLAQPKDAFPLWAGSPPGALGTDPVKDIPTLTPFFPAADKATGGAVVVCPGGGYGGLASHEGRDYALWLNQHGIAAFVLKYRLGSAGYRHPVMMGDLKRAVRYVRAKAADWKLDPKRIGVMGSSAGGHLASTAVTHFDTGKGDAPDPIERASSRPDLGILCYPVITMGPNTHNGSKNNLLGKELLARAGETALQRTAGHQGHAAVFCVAHLGGQGREGGERARICRRPATQRCAV